MTNSKKLTFSSKWIIAIAFFAVLGCKTTAIKNTGASASSGPEGDYFQIAVLPDTQYYTAIKNGGTMEMMEDQINWIRENRKKEKIAYVIQLGDLSDHGEKFPEEWVRASTEMYKLEKDGIPYGIAVGNHDETPNGKPTLGSPNTSYTKYFGKSHFKGKPWYGGAMGDNDNNDNHFDLFTGNGDKFIAIYLAFNAPNNPGYNVGYEKQTMHWVDSVLTVYADRKAIMVTHGMIGKPKGSTSDIKAGDGNNSVAGQLTPQGKVIYQTAKLHNNVFLMLGGHIAGEAFRRDEYNGNFIKTYLTDYQSRQNPPYGGQKDRNGGNGLMRVMKFDKSNQTLSVKTFAPRRTGMIREEDGDSQFTEPLYK